LTVDLDDTEETDESSTKRIRKIGGIVKKAREAFLNDK
jgi:hypothetical protein